jgi:putative cardiolipin synthase
VRDGSFASRIVFSLHDFARINRRMHNKLLVADNSVAIAGGRNVADEYFGRAEPANFIDMDVLVAGAAVRAMSAAFDAYWNNDHVFPVQSLNPMPADAARAAFDARLAGLGPVAPAAALDALGQSGVAAQLAAGRLALAAGAVRVLADSPAKVEARDDADGEVMQAHLALIRAARSDVLIASPYFVPGERGVAAMQQAVDRDVRLTVLTNSLATTDEPLVHYGYSRYRHAMLKMGAALYELMPGAAGQRADDALKGSYGPHGSLGRLHAKLAVVDQRWLFIGSMNMDRRSAHCNQEGALVIDSPALAAQAATVLHRDQAAASYRVTLDAAGSGLNWSAGGGAARVDVETGALSALARLKLQMLSALLDESLL